MVAHAAARQASGIERPSAAPGIRPTKDALTAALWRSDGHHPAGLAHVAPRPTLSHNALCVLTAMVQLRGDGAPACTVSGDALADMALLSLRTVQRAITELTQRGIVRRHVRPTNRARNALNVYEILWGPVGWEQSSETVVFMDRVSRWHPTGSTNVQGVTLAGEREYVLPENVVGGLPEPDPDPARDGPPMSAKEITAIVAEEQLTVALLAALRDALPALAREHEPPHGAQRLHAVAAAVRAAGRTHAHVVAGVRLAALLRATTIVDVADAIARVTITAKTMV